MKAVEFWEPLSMIFLASGERLFSGNVGLHDVGISVRSFLYLLSVLYIEKLHLFFWFYTRSPSISPHTRTPALDIF